MDEKDDRFLNDIVYDMLYNKISRYNLTNTGFSDINDLINIKNDSESEYEFQMKCDLFGIQNENLKNAFVERMNNGKEQEKLG